MEELRGNKLTKRPTLSRELDSTIFKKFYYLKEELIEFCRCHRLPTSGGKIELTERVFHFLETGEVMVVKTMTKKIANNGSITENSVIEPNFVCSEVHRAFFKSKIDKGFSFNVSFQKWLKISSGKTYREAIVAYYEILEQKKNTQTTIDPQFEYNTYIRDYFASNKGGCLTDAIKCWKFKKNEFGHNRYEKEDLAILEKS